MTTMGTGSWCPAKSDTVSRARPGWNAEVCALADGRTARSTPGARFDRFSPRALALEQLGDMGSRGHGRVDRGRGVIAGVDPRDGRIRRSAPRPRDASERPVTAPRVSHYSRTVSRVRVHRPAEPSQARHRTGLQDAVLRSGSRQRNARTPRFRWPRRGRYRRLILVLRIPTIAG